ncbi:HAT2 [[Candida] subhashii]|uniref:HAT2 n=1 Tax=[Candida] subhashii TaxID=561895 RepID=A0A8J5QKM5_9ASCO|nr:HAT2 [[Candida] subhashii]KAG7662198.1 HAT2 [[Candida] subhashii]
MSELTAENGEAQGELTIKEEYQLWRKNCRYMYEFVSETALTWPSLTIQWLPETTTNDDEGAIDAKLLLGTHTSGEDKNYLKLATTQIPIDSSIGSKKPNSRIKIIKKFENNAEICRTRYMPQDPNIVATINGLGEVDLYDLTDDSKMAKSHFVPHNENGYGLCWSPFKRGLLLTGADDKFVCVTDTSKDNSIIFKNDIQKDIVNDTKWHMFDENMFASVSEDSYVYLFDLRSKEVISRFYAEESKGINSLAFSPFSHNLMAIGNTNSNINLLDLRKLGNAPKNKSGLLHTMMGHGDSITCMEFSPDKDGILASGGQDRRLIIWDLFKIGEEQQQEDAEDGCPELFMMHAGHTGAVTDLSWCPFKSWTIGSVADDNIVHLWEVGKNLINSEENEEIDIKELE